MSKFNGKKKLSTTIHNSIKRNIGINTAVRFGAEFESFYLDNKISYSLIFAKPADKYFKEFFENCLGFIFESDNDDFDIFTLSLLHEIGHIKTMKKFTQKQIDKDFEKKDEISEWAMEAKRTHFVYFSLPTEIAASRWAVEWAEKHPKKYKALKEDIRQSVFEFYKTNNLETDDSVFNSPN